LAGTVIGMKNPNTSRRPGVSSTSADAQDDHRKTMITLIALFIFGHGACAKSDAMHRNKHGHSKIGSRKHAKSAWLFRIFDPNSRRRRGKSDPEALQGFGRTKPVTGA